MIYDRQGNKWINPPATPPIPLAPAQASPFDDFSLADQTPAPHAPKESFQFDTAAQGSLADANGRDSNSWTFGSRGSYAPATAAQSLFAEPQDNEKAGAVSLFAEPQGSEKARSDSLFAEPQDSGKARSVIEPRSSFQFDVTAQRSLAESKDHAVPSASFEAAGASRMETTAAAAGFELSDYAKSSTRMGLGGSSHSAAAGFELSDYAKSSTGMGLRGSSHSAAGAARFESAYGEKASSVFEPRDSYPSAANTLGSSRDEHKNREKESSPSGQSVKSVSSAQSTPLAHAKANSFPTDPVAVPSSALCFLFISFGLTWLL